MRGYYFSRFQLNQNLSTVSFFLSICLIFASNLFLVIIWHIYLSALIRAPDLYKSNLFSLLPPSSYMLHLLMSNSVPRESAKTWQCLSVKSWALTPSTLLLQLSPVPPPSARGRVAVFVKIQTAPPSSIYRPNPVLQTSQQKR